MARSLIFAAIAAASCHRAPPAATTPLDAVLARWDRDDHGDLRAVVVRRGGALVAERYFNGETPTGLHDVRSAGKSITSLLVGIAIDRGMIRSVDVRLGDALPAASASPIAAATLQDLLTMRSGLAADDDDASSPGNEDRLDAAPDPVAFAIGVPARAAPGAGYLYSSVTSYLVGLVVERAAGQRLDELAAAALFAPLGITAWAWQRDRAGHAKGQGNLSLTARDVAALGQLVLDGGVAGGRRVVSERWIRDSLEPRVAIGAVDRYADGYGYFWYTKTHRIGGRDVRVSFASGNGGNKIYVVPSLGAVVAITSRAYDSRHGQRRSEEILLALLPELARR